tara:strand:+ start:3551 stop:4432 length:882 start_codon:yes stop_codon:yes gene_type:complete
MKKITINRFDLTALSDTFMASGLACGVQDPEEPYPEPEHVEYVRNKEDWKGITYFTDKLLHLAPRVKSDIKIAILCEPEHFMPQIYQLIKHYEKHYDLIFTYNDTLLQRDPNKYVFAPADMPIIEEKNCKIHKKSKLISMVYSDKDSLPGHKLRHAIADKIIPKMGFLDKVDFFGRGTNNPIRNKSAGCIDYMFQIAIENTKSKNYYADKILDCFITGCIPIYWGCPNIGDYFDERGILTFNTASEFIEILKSLNREKYESMLEYAKINFELAKKHSNPDDNIYLEIKKRLLK